MLRVDVNPDLLRWARERSGLEVAALEETRKFTIIPPESNKPDVARGPSEP